MDDKKYLFSADQPEVGISKKAIHMLHRAYLSGYTKGVDGDDSDFESFLGKELLRAQGVEL